MSKAADFLAIYRLYRRWNPRRVAACHKEIEMTITTKVYAYWRKNPYTGEDEFGVASWDFRALDAKARDGRVFVKEIEVSFDVPADFNPIPEQLAVLEDAKRQANAAFQQRITEIDRQIQSLLAIEHSEAA